MRKKHLTYIEKYGLYQITIYPKANQRYVTFCTPECASEINSYFDYRRSCGESIGDESPVIRKDFDADRPGQRIEPATVKALKFVLERIVRNAGLKMKHEDVNGRQTQRTKIMLVHGLFIVLTWAARDFRVVR